MKTYISGKITGLDLADAFNLFDQAEKHLISENKVPVNVMKKFKDMPGWGWKDYMVADIKELLECDAIFMLSNWEDSKGAKIEHAIAQGLGLPILYQTK